MVSLSNHEVVARTISARIHHPTASTLTVRYPIGVMCYPHGFSTIGQISRRAFRYGVVAGVFGYGFPAEQ